MEPTTTILYDFWQFMFFATIFTSIVAYISYTRGFEAGANTLFQSLIDDGVIEIEERDEDIY